MCHSLVLWIHSQSFQQSLILLYCAHANHHISVFCCVNSIGHDIRMMISESLWIHSSIQIVWGLIDQTWNCALIQRSFQVNSFSCLFCVNQSCQNRIWCVQRCQNICNRETHLERLLFVSCQVHKPCLRLYDIVKGWKICLTTKVSIPWNWTVNQLWIVFFESLIIDLQLLGDSRDKIFQNDVRFFHQIIKHFAAFRGLEVERNAFLIAVDWLKIGGSLVVPWRSPKSCWISFRGFYLDDLTSKTWKNRWCIRSDNYSWKIEDSFVFYQVRHLIKTQIVINLFLKSNKDLFKFQIHNNNVLSIQSNIPFFKSKWHYLNSVQNITFLKASSKTNCSFAKKVYYHP